MKTESTSRMEENFGWRKVKHGWYKQIDGYVKRSADFLDFYLWEEKPLGEAAKLKKITIPRDKEKIKIGDSVAEHLKVEAIYQNSAIFGDNDYWIRVMRAELRVGRSPGYEGEIDENYWMWIPEVGDFVGIRHSSSYVERKGYDHFHEGPFRPSQKHIDNLMTAGYHLEFVRACLFDDSILKLGKPFLR